MVDTNLKKDEDKGTGSQSTSQTSTDDSSKGTGDIKEKGSMSGYSTRDTKNSY